MIDSTIVRAHQHSAGAIKKTKDQSIGESSGGNAHDLDGADQLLPDIKAKALLADKAFDTDERVIEPLIRGGIIPLIPSKKS